MGKECKYFDPSSGLHIYVGSGNKISVMALTDSPGFA